MDPIPVTATALVMLPGRPRGKPRETVADLAMCDEAIKAFTTAKIAILAAQGALDGLAAVDAMPEPGAVADAVIHEAWCAGGHDDNGPCPPQRGDGPSCDAGWQLAPGSALWRCSLDAGHPGIRHEAWAGTELCAAWDGGTEYPAALPQRDDTWVKGAPADGGGDLPAPAAPQCPAGLLRETEDWGAACRKDAGHEPPHDGQDGDWTDGHPRHVPDLDAHEFPAAGDEYRPGPAPRALITLECGCSLTGPVTTVKKIYCDTHGRHEPVASVTPYDLCEAPDEDGRWHCTRESGHDGGHYSPLDSPVAGKWWDAPRPVSYLPVAGERLRGARIGGAS